MVADFGIALAVSAAAGGRMTETGLSLGTPHYMSPEQATAENPGPPFRVVSRQPLFSATMSRGDTRHRAFAVSPDDQSFLFVDLQARPSAELVIVLNWFAELKRLMSRQ